MNKQEKKKSLKIQRPGSCQSEKDGRGKRWGRLAGTNFQLQNKWVIYVKCTVWRI